MSSFIPFLRRKVCSFFLSLWITSTITFFLMHAIPGDPFMQEQALPVEITQAMKIHYGLHKPVTTQYVHYIKNVVQCDLGSSMKYQDRKIIDIIKEGFPISCTLGIEVLLLSCTLGIALGAVAALYQGKWQDSALLIYSVLGISIPNFVLAIGFQFLFSMKLHLLPVARWGSFAHTILPALSLAALPTAFIARLFRSSVLEVLHQDYILTAKAKGLSYGRIILHHVLRNAFLPVLAYLGPLSASILTGTFAVEKIFGIPGLGQWFVLGITNRDYPMIMGITIFYSAILLMCVLISDILSALIDPRIQIKENL